MILYQVWVCMFGELGGGHRESEGERMYWVNSNGFMLNVCNNFQLRFMFLIQVDPFGPPGLALPPAEDNTSSTANRPQSAKPPATWVYSRSSSNYLVQLLETGTDS